jgi:hypothetical protein
MYAQQHRLPQWIGVKNGWHLESPNPLEHLVSITPDMLKTHALLIGATGSGKTNLMHHLIAQDIERGHSVGVLDLRGDLIDSVLELAAGRVHPSNVTLIPISALLASSTRLLMNLTPGGFSFPKPCDTL